MRNPSGTGLCNHSGVENRTLIFNHDIRGIESVGKNQIENKIEGQGQSSRKLIWSLTVLIRKSKDYVYGL